MERSEIRDNLFALAKPFIRRSPDGLVLTEETSLVNDLKIDSADILELVLSVEERFSIEVGDKQMDRIATVGDLVSMVAELTCSPAADRA